MGTPAITPNPYAEFQKPVTGANPYADFQAPNPTPAKPPPTQPGNIFTSGHPFDTFKANVNEAQQGAQPGDGIMMGALKNFGAGAGDVIHSVGHAALHPIDTISSSIHDQQAESAKPLLEQAKDFVTSGKLLGPGGESIVDTAKGLVHSPDRTLGQLGTGAVLGEVGGAALGGIKAVGSAARTAAIGDTDAAALRGLRVPANGKKVLPMQSSVQTARPFLQGANSLEDLQARVAQAKSEIFDPYKQTLDAVGDNPVKGPDGMTTIRALEDERQELSAMNRGLKTGDPSALRLAEQKGMSQAESLAREKAIQAHLDPALSQFGIDPQGIRKAYGSVSRIGNQVEGRSTLLEKPQPSGLGKIGQISLKQPLQAPAQILSGMRDIVAGRPMFSMSPSDVGVREGFASAGPKPDFGKYTPFKPNGLLDSPAIELGRSPEAGGTPEGYHPPPFYHDTDAMRLGRLLHAPPIELGGATEGPKGQGFRYDTAPMRMGKTLPESTGEDMPLSSHADIFKDQIPQATRVKPKPKTIEGKK